MLNMVCLRIIKIANVLLMAMPIYYIWLDYYSTISAIHYYFWGNVILAGIFGAIYTSYSRVYGIMSIAYSKISELFYGQLLAIIFSDSIMYGIFCLLAKRLVVPLYLIEAFLIQIIISFVWSRIARKIYFSLYKPLRTIIVYDLREGMEDLINDYSLTRKFQVVTTYHITKVCENLDLLLQAEAVFISGVHSHERNVVLKYCVRNGIQCYMIPRIGDVLLLGAKQMHLFHLPILMTSRYSPDPEYLWIKRIFDIVSSGALLLLISPIMIFTAIAIKLYDGGSIFYKQTRLTKDGKLFDVYKFRSMREDAEKDGVARLSTGDNDDRITPIGRVIRKYRIDELPQLLNIIEGSMSVVGPRPERPEIAVQYEETMPEFCLRLQCKAGLTGYAQVYGKYNTTPYDKLQMDLMYIAKPSFFEDLRIIFATIKILFVAESTEGVTIGAITAQNGKKN